MIETSPRSHMLKSVLAYTAGQRNLITECNKRSRKCTYRSEKKCNKKSLIIWTEKKNNNNISKRQLQARTITKQHRILNAKTYMDREF